MVHFVETEKTGMVLILRKGQKPSCAPWQPLPTILAVKSSVRSNPATVLDPQLDFHDRPNYPFYDGLFGDKKMRQRNKTIRRFVL